MFGLVLSYFVVFICLIIYYLFPYFVRLCKLSLLFPPQWFAWCVICFFLCWCPPLMSRVRQCPHYFSYPTNKNQFVSTSFLVNNILVCLCLSVINTYFLLNFMNFLASLSLSWIIFILLCFVCNPFREDFWKIQVLVCLKCLHICMLIWLDMEIYIQNHFSPNFEDMFFTDIFLSSFCF